MTNGIDFVIGGKDKAEPAMSSVEKSLERMERKTDALAASTGKLTMAAGALAAAYGLVKSGLAAIGGISSLNAAYDTQVGAVEGLNVALRLQGDAVEEESSRLQAFASEMQAFAAVGDEVTLGLMQQASMLGVQTEQLDDAAKAAIGLSEATGRSLDESLKLVNNALAGEFGSFGEIIPQIRQLTTDEEKLAAVLDLASKGLEAKAEASKTVAGMSERADNAIGDLMEVVGEIIAPIRMLISSGLETLAESLQTVLVPAVEWSQNVLANIGPLMDWVREKVVSGVNLMVQAFTFFEVILTNLDSVWKLVVAQAELYMLQISGAVKHALTEVVPAYAMWFGENFVNLMKDAMSLAFTVVVNGIAKLVDTFEALWDFIASGGEADVMGRLGEISGRSWLDGFQSSLTELPDITARAITSREQELANKVSRIADNLGQQFSDKMAARMIEFESGTGIGAEFAKGMDLQMADAGGSGGNNTLAANESRLLTRGPGRREDLLDQIRQVLEDIRSNTKDTTRMVPQI